MKVQIYSPSAARDTGTAQAAKMNPILSFHGFPALRSKQNRDIARSLANGTGRDVHLFLYPGLTQAPGSFSFRQCVSDVHRHVEYLLENGTEKFDLLGHSWGGFLVLTIVSRFPTAARRMALLSPLLDFASPESTIPWFHDLATENRSLDLGDIIERAKEFAQMPDLYSVDRMIASLPTTLEVLFLQAREDKMTPTSIAEAKVGLFPHPIDFRVVETDHSFLVDRKSVTGILENFFKGAAPGNAPDVVVGQP